MEDAALILLAAGTLTTTTTTTAIDLSQGVGGFAPDSMPPSGAGQPVAAVVPLTGVSGTTPTFTFKLQDSPDNSTFTDISPTRSYLDPGTPGVVPGTFYVGAFVRQRYVRAVITIGGTTPSFNFNDIYLEPLIAHAA